MASQRICVVTGANKGIGFGIMKEMCAKFDGLVYLTARNKRLGQAAVQELAKLGLSSRFHQLDISDSGSISSFASFIKSTYGGLDVLVNNAGVSSKSDTTDSFGKQAVDTIGVNYFGTLAVCEALFPLLRPHARVVNVSSMMGHLSKINGAEPQATALRNQLASTTLMENQLTNLVNAFLKLAEEGGWAEEGWPNSTYVVSKVALSALTRIQQKAFDSDPREDLVINHCHPGYVDTDMTSHKGPLTIEQGAVCPSYLALLPPNISEPKGAYLWYDKQVVDWVNGPLPAV